MSRYAEQESREAASNPASDELRKGFGAGRCPGKKSHWTSVSQTNKRGKAETDSCKSQTSKGHPYLPHPSSRCNDHVLHAPRHTIHPVDRYPVLRTRTHHNHHILCQSLQLDTVSSLTHGRFKAQRTPLADRNVHEQIKRRRGPVLQQRTLARPRDPQLRQPSPQVLRAGCVGVSFREAQASVARRIARREQRVMDPWGSVGYKLEERAAEVRDQDVGDLWPEVQRAGAGVWEGEEGVQPIGCEREGPEVDDLRAVRVDYADCVVFGQRDGAAAARADCVCLGVHDGAIGG